MPLQVALAYALTVHKAQGSEYPVVVVALAPEHAPMLQREPPTRPSPRAQHLLVIVANRESLAACVARRPARGGARSTAPAQRVRATLSTLAESPRPPQRAPLPAPSAGAGERMGTRRRTEASSLRSSERRGLSRSPRERSVLAAARDPPGPAPAPLVMDPNRWPVIATIIAGRARAASGRHRAPRGARRSISTIVAP